MAVKLAASRSLLFFLSLGMGIDGALGGEENSTCAMLVILPEGSEGESESGEGGVASMRSS